MIRLLTHAAGPMPTGGRAAFSGSGFIGVGAVLPFAVVVGLALAVLR